MSWAFINNEHHTVATCPACKTVHTVPPELYATAMKNRMGNESTTIFCPYGHKWHYKSHKEEAEEEKVRRERDLLKQQLAYKDDAIRAARERAEHAERSASAYKGKVTRLKNRAAAGLCPCCNRSFQNLSRHMASQHPQFKKEDDAA